MKTYDAGKFDIAVIGAGHAGIEAALAADPELEVLVAGAAAVVAPFAASHSRARALVTTEVIAMSEHPAQAVRKKKDASIVRAAAAVRAGEADGLFSAGSTGAVLEYDSETDD